MINKMKKKAFPVAVMCCSFTAMMLIDIFAWNFSSILLMLIAAIVSVLVFAVQEALSENGGDLK